MEPDLLFSLLSPLYLHLAWPAFAHWGRSNGLHGSDWFVFLLLVVSHLYLKWSQTLISKSPVIMVTIAVGLQDKPPTAPQDGVWVSDYKIVENPSFTKAISAVSSIVYAYAGTPGESTFY